MLRKARPEHILRAMVANYGAGPHTWDFLDRDACIAAADEIERLRGLINTPHTDDFMEAVRLEAAHQQERWGSAHDAGKTAADWFWLLGHLAGKAVAAFLQGDRAKGLHHIISSGAALLNWHRHVTGEMTGMRPGIEPPAGTEG